MVNIASIGSFDRNALANFFIFAITVKLVQLLVRSYGTTGAGLQFSRIQSAVEWFIAVDLRWGAWPMLHQWWRQSASRNPRRSTEKQCSGVEAWRPSQAVMATLANSLAVIVVPP